MFESILGESESIRRRQIHFHFIGIAAGFPFQRLRLPQLAAIVMRITSALGGARSRTFHND